MREAIYGKSTKKMFSHNTVFCDFYRKSNTICYGTRSDGGS